MPSASCRSSGRRAVRTIISRRDIAMDKALAHQAHTAEQIEQVATQTHRHKRRQACPASSTASRERKRASVSPSTRFHDNCRHTVDLAPAIEAGKALEARKGAMAFVFLAKRCLEIGDQRLVSGIVVELIARRRKMSCLSATASPWALTARVTRPIPPRRMVASSANSIVKRRR